MEIQYKTIRSTRWVFANGEEVGTIEPMESAAGKWAFIPLNLYGYVEDRLFQNTFYGRTIGDVRHSIASQVRRLHVVL